MTGSIGFGTRRFVLAWVYFGMHLGFGKIAPHDFIMSAEFGSLPYWQMYLYMTVWVKSILAKYIGAWLLSEGACIYSGLAYNGRKEDGTILWNGRIVSLYDENVGRCFLNFTLEPQVAPTSNLGSLSIAITSGKSSRASISTPMLGA